MASATTEPKGVKVSFDLLKALKAENKIVMRDIALNGVIPLGFKWAFFKNTILVFDAELDGLDFQLPPDATKPSR